MSTVISQLDPDAKVKVRMAPDEVWVQVGEPGVVCAMTRAASHETISITSDADGSKTVKLNAVGTVSASGPGSISRSGSVRLVSTGQGSVVGLSLGDVTIGGGNSQVSSTPRPNEDYPYTVYVPSGTVVEFYDDQHQLVKTTNVA